MEAAVIDYEKLEHIEGSLNSHNLAVEGAQKLLEEYVNGALAQGLMFSFHNLRDELLELIGELQKN